MLQGDAIPIDSADRGPAPAEFFEILVATRSLPIRIEYAAIRGLRSVMAAEGQSVGLLLGTRSPEALSVDRCELLPPEAVSLDAIVRAYSQHSAQRLVGFFRTQAAGWPEMQKADREIAQRCFRHPGSLFLLIQTPARRPWSAALFDLDAEAASPAKKPALEFFFDEYLLRNGYSTGLVPAPEQQELPDDPPLKSRRTPWIALGILGALILLGTVGYLWFSEKNRNEPASIASSSPLALKVVRSGNDFEVSWDRLAPVLQQASGGSVTIRDGAITRTVSLSVNQLREGRILYAPLFGDLNFRLEIQQGQRTQAESVQVLSWEHPPAETLANLEAPQSVPPPSAQPDSPWRPSSGRLAADARLNPTTTAPAPALPTPRVKLNEPAPVVPARAPVAPTTPDKAPADRGVSPAKPVALAPTPLPPAAPTAQPVPAQPAPVQPAPAVVSESLNNLPAPSAVKPVPATPVAPPPAPVPLQAAPLSTVAPAAPAPNRDPTSLPLPSPSRSQSPDASFVAPVPLKRANPNITPALKRAVESRGGHVRLSVRVMVDTNGKVRNAEALALDGKATFSDNLIRSAAIEAARQWTFSPGKLNGKPAAGDFTIDFVFQ